jgi:hypothetical protein
LIKWFIFEHRQPKQAVLYARRDCRFPEQPRAVAAAAPHITSSIYQLIFSALPAQTGN